MLGGAHESAHDRSNVGDTVLHDIVPMDRKLAFEAREAHLPSRGRCDVAWCGATDAMVVVVMVVVMVVVVVVVGGDILVVGGGKRRVLFLLMLSVVVTPASLTCGPAVMVRAVGGRGGGWNCN